jgi:hypothetical protein
MARIGSSVVCEQRPPPHDQPVKIESGNCEANRRQSERGVYNRKQRKKQSIAVLSQAKERRKERHLDSRDELGLAGRRGHVQAFPRKEKSSNDQVDQPIQTREPTRKVSTGMLEAKEGEEKKRRWSRYSRPRERSWQLGSLGPDLQSRPWSCGCRCQRRRRSLQNPRPSAG